MKQEKTPLRQIVKRVTFASIDEWFSRKFLRRDISEIIVFFSVLCYTVIFSYFTILKYNTFNAYGWDLGIFNQSFWTTTHNVQLFGSTVEQFISQPGSVFSGSFFGTHFSPILFVLLPIYSIFSSPQTLLVSQSFILALGAVPLYFFAKNALNNRVIAVVFSISYLFYPLVQGVNWFDFHVQAFLPLFFFSTMYFLVKEKWLPYFLFIFLSLSVAENVPITVVFIGLYCFWRFRKPIVEALKTRKLLDLRLIAPVITIAIALVWIVFAGWIRQTYFPFDPAYTQLYKAVDNWSVLGVPDDPIKLPLYILTGIPTGNTLNALAYDFSAKLIYVVLLFGPLLFLSFRNSITAISLAWLVPAIFSNYAPYYMIGDQFPAYPVAFIFLGAVETVRIATTSKGKTSIRLPFLKKFAITIRLPFLKKFAIAIFSTSLLFTLLLSPLSPVVSSMGNSFPRFADYNLPVMTNHTKILGEIAALVPDDASILTINTIFAHFSGRANAYAYPLDWMIQQYNDPMKQSYIPEMQSYIEGLFQKSDYVMVDNVTNWYGTALIVSNGTTPIDMRIQSFRDFRLRAYSDGEGIYLYMKNYSDIPLTFDYS